jgi:Kef-type K+ transport system membrane component KefB
MELVALNNLFSFLAFSALVPVGHLSRAADLSVALLHPLYQLFGSLLVAIVIAIILVHAARLTRRAPQYRMALIIGAIMLGLGTANALHLSALFLPLALGVVVKTLEGEETLSDVKFGEIFELFFIVLFVYAGAKIQLGELATLGWIAIALVGLRIVAKGLPVFGMARWHGLQTKQAAASGLLLVPMAGLAIGLAQTADTLFALEAVQLNAIVLTTVAILETIGPPIAAWAFKLAGESGTNATT